MKDTESCNGISGAKPPTTTMAARASTSNAAAASIDDLVTASADANGSVEAVQQQVVPLLRKIVRGAGEGRRNSLGDKLANGTDPLEALSAESDTLCFVCIMCVHALLARL